MLNVRFFLFITSCLLSGLIIANRTGFIYWKNDSNNPIFLSAVTVNQNDKIIVCGRNTFIRQYSSTGQLEHDLDTSGANPAFYYDIIALDENTILAAGFKNNPQEGLIIKKNYGNNPSLSVLEPIISQDGLTAKSYYRVIKHGNKIFAVGISSNNKGLISCYTFDNQLNDYVLDTQFNNGAGFIIDNQAFEYNSIKIDPDEKIVVVGKSPSNRGLIRRYNIDGTPDTNFNQTSFSINNNALSFYDLVIENTKIFVAGQTSDNNGLIAEYNFTGSLVPTVFNQNGTDSSFYYRLIINNNKIITVGSTKPEVTPNNSGDGLIARYNFDGTLDTNFNIIGYINTENGTNSRFFYGISAYTGNKIVVVGRADHGSGVIVRYNDNGSLDLTFNPAAQGNGIIVEEFPLDDRDDLININLPGQNQNNNPPDPIILPTNNLKNFLENAKNNLTRLCLLG